MSAPSRQIAVVHFPQLALMCCPAGHRAGVGVVVDEEGVPLERMMVLSPSTSMVARTAVRAMRTQSFCAMVVDATGIQALDRWPVVVRRLTHAAEDSAATVFVLT